jgi:hypothetical protein
MKRVFVVLALILAIAFPALAQIQSGTIYGTIRDNQGGVLPGVSVSLTGPSGARSFTTEADGQYRFLNLPPGTYTISAALQGFSTLRRENIVVTVGANVEIPVTMAVAAVEESITVSGSSPIIDTKSMGTATNFTQDELAKVPNSRDPWALLRTVPGVVLDRVNIAGNETGQQSNFVSKGSNQRDTVWTMDGVVITDTATSGASPTYFDYDAFDEIQISTGGNDIRQPTGGAGLNFVVKRGTNQFKGTARGYFTNDSLEAENLPEELRARGVTPETGDHNDQISDFGFDVGGPIIRDKLFGWGSWTQQDIRLIRQAGNVVDRTVLKTHNIKVNWQATSKDNINWLWFNGDKVKTGRATGNAQFEPASARWVQGNYYPDNPFHGLWKIENNRVMSSNLFITGRYSYYGTGFSLEPIGGLDQQAGISTRLGQTFGSTLAQFFLRPQHSVSADGNYFRSGWGGTHDFKFGAGYRRTDAFAQQLWPGDKVVAFENSATDFRARLYREGAGSNRSEYAHVYVGDTISLDRLTLDLGLRFDRQWGSALPSTTQSNGAFPNLVPGIEFSGYDSPFTWNNFTPRAGVTYALDEGRKTILRANVSRYAGQLTAINQLIGFSNPSSAAGWVEYPWTDANGDHLVQINEVNVNAPFITQGGGFNPANPTAVTSANVIDPDLEAPVTTGLVVGFDRELMPNLAVQVSYNYSRTKNLSYIPWRGLTVNDYAAGPVVSGTLPDGSPYSVQTFIPNATLIAANGNGRILTNNTDYVPTFNGVEIAVNKRLSNRWMMRAGISFNQATNQFDAERPVNSLGNPTPLDGFSSTANPSQGADPIQDGGPLAPSSAGSGSGEVFINAKWQVNVNGVYQLPWNMEIAGNLFGKQGTPYPLFIATALGRDGSQNVLVTPELDALRFEDLWNLDLRVAKNIAYNRLNVQLVADLFNVTNNNVDLNRQRNLGSPVFNQLTSNLSPRILRFGVRIGF